MSSSSSDSSGSLDPLPLVFQHGLIFVFTFGYLSLVATLGLLIYLTFKLIRWHSSGELQGGCNQFILLLYNLALADLQQAIGFSMTQAWVLMNKIDAQSRICWAQSWFVSTGDMASGLWILAIAVHTFFAVVQRRRLPSNVFFAMVAGVWIFVFVMAIVPLAVHPRDLYSRAAAWCWIDEKYAVERLWLNYLWIFLSMFGSIFIYAIIYVVLRLRSHNSPHSEAQLLLQGAKYMLLYPSVYVLATLPLAAGRMAAVSNKIIPDWYYCLAGSAITSCGWLDTLLYSLTRRGLVFSDKPPMPANLGIETFGLLGASEDFSGIVTTISGPLTRMPVQGVTRNNEPSITPNHGLKTEMRPMELISNRGSFDPFAGVVTTTTTVEFEERDPSQPVE